MRFKFALLIIAFVGFQNGDCRSSPTLHGSGYHGDTRQRRSANEMSDSDITPSNRTLCQSDAEEPSNRVHTAERVAALRDVMAWPNISLDAYLIPYEDEHISEPADYDGKLKYISGFSGSNGYAWVVGDAGGNRQAVSTDGRYFLQADQQMDCDWILMKQRVTGYPGPADWLLSILPNNSRVGMDPKLVSINRWQSYEKAFMEGSVTLFLEPVEQELVDYIWTEDRPDRPNEPLMIHTVEFAGREWTDKVEEVRGHLTSMEADALFISALDETAWLFNLRGHDRSTSPLFYSYGLVMQDEIRLYLSNHSKLLTQEIQDHLNTGPDGSCGPAADDCVIVREYNDALSDLATLSSTAGVSKIWITPTSNYATYGAAGEKRFVDQSPIQLMKAVKNSVERQKYRECQVRDSAAVVDFVSQLEEKITSGGSETEMSAAALLESIRAEDDYFVMNSFDAISAMGENAAVIHYRATESTDTTITDQGVYMLDSGGQYFDGTTDVTRTFHFGTPTETEIEAYTRVLIGVIELATTVWPKGRYGYEIDVRARASLWQNGWNYNHGTGHGIGYFLNVHEGPGRISIGYSESQSSLYDGMYFSDEPGFYLDGSFGIRLETIVEVEIKDTPNRFNDVDYLGFRPVTFVPFEPKLINYDMLTAVHRQWLNQYNTRCITQTGQRLMDQGKMDAYDWLTARTARLPEVPVWMDSAPDVSGSVAVKCVNFNVILIIVVSILCLHEYPSF